MLRCIASWDGLLCVLPPPRATNFHVAKTKSDVYFLQHENLLGKKDLNLQRNIVARQVARKMLPVLLTNSVNIFDFILYTFTCIIITPI